MSEQQTRKMVLESLVENLKAGRAYYFRGIQDEELENQLFPSGGSPVFGKFWSSVDHVGFGLFNGRTSNGKFDFDGGGALIRPVLPDGDYLAYSEIRTENPQVLEDLKYPFDTVIKALEKEIAEL